MTGERNRVKRKVFQGRGKGTCWPAEGNHGEEKKTHQRGVLGVMYQGFRPFVKRVANIYMWFILLFLTLLKVLFLSCTGF